MLQSQPPLPAVDGPPVQQPPPSQLQPNVRILTASEVDIQNQSSRVQAGIVGANAAMTAMPVAAMPVAAMPVAAIERMTAVSEKRPRGRPIGSKDKGPRKPHQHKYGEPLPQNKHGVYKYLASEMSFKLKDGEDWQATQLSSVNDEHREFLKYQFLRKIEHPVGSGYMWTSPVDVVQYAGLSKRRAQEVSTRQYLEGGLDAHGKRDARAPPPIHRNDMIEMWTGEQNNSVSAPPKILRGLHVCTMLLFA